MIWLWLPTHFASFEARLRHRQLPPLRRQQRGQRHRLPREAPGAAALGRGAPARGGGRAGPSKLIRTSLHIIQASDHSLYIYIYVTYICLCDIYWWFKGSCIFTSKNVVQGWSSCMPSPPTAVGPPAVRTSFDRGAAFAIQGGWRVYKARSLKVRSLSRDHLSCLIKEY